MFSYRIISDGPHRPDKVYLVAGAALFTSGQFIFGKRPPAPAGKAENAPEEESPPLRFVFEEKRQPAQT